MAALCRDAATGITPLGITPLGAGARRGSSLSSAAMQIKSARPIVLMLTSCAVLTLGAYASQENASAQTPPAPAPPPTPVVIAPVPTPPPAPVVVNPAELPPEIIAWDAVDKSVTVNFGEPTGKFQFALTNRSDAPVTVLAVTSSCGCTAAQVPPMPWVIAAGANASFAVNMNLAGKFGTIPKVVTFATDKGTKHLQVRTTILPMPATAGMAPGSREQNQQMALADRQAVFKGDCARCHAETAKDKLGKELYVAVCGVCHDAEHRATMVPDLHIAKTDRNEDYWRNWIANGRQGSLMPAFALPAGGVLSDGQIASLVEYLAKNLPSKATPATAGPANPLELDLKQSIFQPAH